MGLESSKKAWLQPVFAAHYEKFFRVFPRYNLRIFFYRNIFTGIFRKNFLKKKPDKTISGFFNRNFPEKNFQKKVRPAFSGFSFTRIF